MFSHLEHGCRAERAVTGHHIFRCLSIVQHQLNPCLTICILYPIRICIKMICTKLDTSSGARCFMSSQTVSACRRTALSGLMKACKSTSKFEGLAIMEGSLTGTGGWRAEQNKMSIKAQRVREEHTTTAGSNARFTATLKSNLRAVLVIFTRWREHEIGTGCTN